MLSIINKRIIKNILLNKNDIKLLTINQLSQLSLSFPYNNNQCRYFSNNNNNNNKNNIPEDFYDEEVEKEKEFLDITTTLLEKGKLSSLTSMKKDSITWYLSLYYCNLIYLLIIN